MDRSDQKQLEVEREHSQYQNALSAIEQLAIEGVEEHSREEMNRLLNEIRDEASEALEG